MIKLPDRIKTYCHMSTQLACLSNEQLAGLLRKAEQVHQGRGGHGVLLTLNGTKVFVKKVPLTDLEQQPENIMSTTNLFDLPLYYQYGVGSAGFGVWRELAAHVMTTNWVISDECPNFPLMYHWRVLPAIRPEQNHAERLDVLERDVQYWDNSPAVRQRLEAIDHSSSQVLLFLEYVPQTLYQWLGAQLNVGEKEAELAIKFAEDNLRITNDFINARGLLHFDAHFENILTDGRVLYFSDFGLALSSSFELSDAEIQFMKDHHNYDPCSTLVNLLHCIVTNLYKSDNWIAKLQECLNGEQGEIPKAVLHTLKRYAPIAITMDDFYRNLRKVSKSTPYPAARLRSLLSKVYG